MKKLFINCGVCLYIIFISLNSSCKKSNSNSDSKTPDPGFIEFKLNGSVVKMIYSNNVYHYPLVLYKSPHLNTATSYYLNGSELNSNLELNFLTDTLETKSYHYDSLSVAGNSIYVITLKVTYNGVTSVIHNKDDFSDINISSHKNSRVSGTFTGKLTPQTLPIGFGEPGSINITEGKINDVKIIY